MDLHISVNTFNLFWQLCLVKYVCYKIMFISFAKLSLKVFLVQANTFVIKGKIKLYNTFPIVRKKRFKSFEVSYDFS